MELSNTALNIILGVVVMLLLVANFFVRKRKMEKTTLGMVVTVMDELRHNERLTGEFSFHRTINKFRTSHWNKNKNRLDFIPTEVMVRVGKAFDLSDDVNDRINAARRYGSDSYMAAIDIEKLKGPIAGAREALGTWLEENIDTPELQPKKRGMFGGLFGG